MICRALHFRCRSRSARRSVSLLDPVSNQSLPIRPRTGREKRPGVSLAGYRKAGDPEPGRAAKSARSITSAGVDRFGGVHVVRWALETPDRLLGFRAELFDLDAESKGEQISVCRGPSRDPWRILRDPPLPGSRRYGGPSMPPRSERRTHGWPFTSGRDAAPEVGARGATAVRRATLSPVTHSSQTGVIAIQRSSAPAP